MPPPPPTHEKFHAIFILLLPPPEALDKLEEKSALAAAAPRKRLQKKIFFSVVFFGDFFTILRKIRFFSNFPLELALAWRPWEKKSVKRGAPFKQTPGSKNAKAAGERIITCAVITTVIVFSVSSELTECGLPPWFVRHRSWSSLDGKVAFHMLSGSSRRFKVKKADNDGNGDVDNESDMSCHDVKNIGNGEGEEEESKAARVIVKHKSGWYVELLLLRIFPLQFSCFPFPVRADLPAWS